jgi:hypothetical protein
MRIDPVRDRWSRVSSPTAAAFVAEGFPTVDAPALGNALDAAFVGLPVARAGTPSRLAALLQRADIGALILPYGSAFPVEAWGSIRSFLANGGSLVVLGGAPFYQPVRSRAKPDGSLEWIVASRQPTFAHELLIGPAEPWVRDPRSEYATRVVAGTGWTEPFPEVERTWSLTVRLATRRDSPHEDGSAGPRDAVVRPLVHVVDEQRVPRGCPLLEIDRLRGDEAGGRWVVAPCDATLTASIVRAAVNRALEGAAELYAIPTRACVDAGETASLRITRRRASVRAGEAVPRAARVTVSDAESRDVFTGDVALHGSAECLTGVIEVAPASALRPGLYHAAVHLPDASTHPRTTVTGFWVRDERLLADGPALTVSRDWLRKGDAVFPIVGTTYMASDVHRKFLFEPNPHVWDRDFAEMARHGVNFVRTGLWTGWGRAMLDPGAIDEGALAALEAYVLTAATHGIAVCFNFFAFLPPSFTGDNPYLDPRALEGQRELLTLFAARFRGVTWIHWDLINEPSYAPPEWLWHTRGIGDRHERRAFAEWARARHGEASAIVLDRWREPDGSADALVAPPRHDEFGHHVIRDGRRPRKVRDFREYTQDAVASWAAWLRDVLRAAGQDPLVTLGQDEGGTGDRPAQQTMAESLDYTAVHTWWNNDDLLWDGVVTKVPEKPNVHQETGLMRLEDVDGNPWRTPAMAASMLTRKVAYAFAARGAGVIEWAWNINPYQPLDNESVIGLIRPDGTAKPELQALVDAAAFFSGAAPFLDDFQPDAVVMVIPHARLFLGRPGGLDATKAVVRVLAERFGVVPTALSDLRLTAARLRAARLVLLPSAEVLDEAAALALLEAVEAGCRLLVTGAIEGDSYGMPAPSLRALNLIGPSRPLAFHEESRWSATGWISFEGLLIENVRRSLKLGIDSFEGRVWHEPLPIELARDREPLARLLAAALEAAGVETHPSSVPLAARVLLAPKAAFVVCVNETATDAERIVNVDGVRLQVPVEAHGARMALVERPGGRVIRATPGEPIRQRNTGA